MVSACPKFTATARDQNITLRVRYYGAHSQRPVSKYIHTLSNRGSRSPRLDVLMGGQRLQPHIHDGIIGIRDGRRGKVTKFHVFVKNHKHLPVNASLRRWRGVDVQWKGDIVVMKKGKDFDLVNMPPADYRLADFAVKCFIRDTTQRAPFRVPRERHYIKV